MDIKILDSWLREFLETKAIPKQIAEYLSLCGPSVERIERFGNDFLYDIEVTTNRVDSASVYGIAREGSAILPRFNVPAKLRNISQSSKDYKFVKKVSYLNATVDPKLCKRFTSVLIKNVKIGDSPEIIKNRLESAGVRAINDVVDISNYITLELGQPVHTFDYDKIKGHKMILRESKRGEKIATLDGKVFTLSGGDIVIEDGEGRLIDLAGVMGGNLSAVDNNTKNVLLFAQTYDPVKIRKTSMGLAQRTMAATIFEKGTDTELVTPTILKGIEMFKSLTKGIPEKEIIDIYPNPFKSKKISVDLAFVEQRLGISISKKDISNYLNSLGFETSWTENKLSVGVPSFRSLDVLNSEDIVEEIARIYGYYNLPSIVMSGKLTSRATSPEFGFETDIKNFLSGWGGVEVYTSSLVPKDYVNDNALKLKNPLGIDGEYLRTSLMPSLISAAKVNMGTFSSFHLFEMSNVYLPRRNDLPEEKLILAGVFKGYDFRSAKGIIETLLTKLRIDVNFNPTEEKDFVAGKCALLVCNKQNIGKFGYAENTENIYYEFNVHDLSRLSKKNNGYKEIPKFPSQVEDITFIFPEKTYIGNVIKLISVIEHRISSVELKDIFKSAYTFRIEYQDPNKTLTDREVEKIRNKIFAKVKVKLGGQIKN